MKYIIIHPSDNVGVALEKLTAGMPIEGYGIRLAEDICRGHKFALKPIAAGEPIIKYGFPIGTAKQAIAPGCFVHTHNLRTGLDGLLTYSYSPTEERIPIGSVPSRDTFMGYLRRDGSVGIRNDIWIVVTVGCVNGVAQLIADKARKLYPDFEGGFYALTHPYGCSQMGEDLNTTRNMLAALCRHPNAGGVLVLSLGCENNTPEQFREAVGNCDPERIRFLTAQDTEDEVSEALRLIGELVERANRDVRSQQPVSKLRIGLKCGGSDGLSGITANPLLGLVSERLTAAGGTALMTEVPEMFGAETILMNHSADEAVFNRVVSLINDYKRYMQGYGMPIYENPSPGNKAGGLSTLEDKSLGCTQKSGRSTVTDVCDFGECAVKPGLALLNGPGNDMVAVTTEACSGAQLVLFTTGRGTPMGSPVPVIKIATNSALAAKKPHWIDFNAGVLAEGKEFRAALNELWKLILSVASGEKQTCSELLGDRSLTLFKNGITM